MISLDRMSRMQQADKQAGEAEGLTDTVRRGRPSQLTSHAFNFNCDFCGHTTLNLCSVCQVCLCAKCAVGHIYFAHAHELGLKEGLVATGLAPSPAGPEGAEDSSDTRGCP